MREDNLLAVQPREFVTTTDSNHSLEIYLNLSRRMRLSAVDQLWVAYSGTQFWPHLTVKSTASFLQKSAYKIKDSIANGIRRGHVAHEMLRELWVAPAAASSATMVRPVYWVSLII